MDRRERIASEALERVRSARRQIERSIGFADRGFPLAAEPERERLIQRLQGKAGLSREDAIGLARGLTDSRTQQSGPERIWGRTADFVGVAFLRRGLAASQAVARIAFRSGNALGTGFLVSGDLLLTNHHVIRSAAETTSLEVQFDYELDWSGNPVGVTSFALDPTRFFVTDPATDLDYTLVAVGPRRAGARSLADFGYCALSDASDKHALGEFVNVVQHPDGRYKEVVLRENQLVARLSHVLHYLADTEPGSSGSPVFNHEWQVVALHHWGGPYRNTRDASGRAVRRDVNEGIRVSAIVRELRGRLAGLPLAERNLLDAALALGSERAPLFEREPSSPPSGPRPGPDGSTIWQIPIEVAVRIPAALGAAAAIAPVETARGAAAAPAAENVKPSEDYSDRGGYKPKFLGPEIPLPKLSAAQRKLAARVRDAEPGDDPFELKYHHFSVVMNKERRLAFFTACNIDGRRAKSVDRKTGVVTPLAVDDIGERAAESAEASDAWYVDKRIDPAELAGADVYEGQRVPGFPNPRAHARIARMFQRGHLVRRMDPAWGSDAMALKADADTFHWTNCAPQVGFFNQGTADPDQHGTGGGRLWRAIEDYVLANAAAEKARVSVFTGPVFRANDRKFRDIRVPRRFWKVLVWAEQGALRSLALIADQSRVIQVWPERLEEALEAESAEAYADPDELEKVSDFLTTVKEIERLTRLEFGPAVVAADLRAGERRAAGEAAEAALAAVTSEGRRRSARRSRTQR
jgi:endonuclease G